ncbi:MAG: hypothetical protein K6L81_03050 [Agarilytica sp.]
MCKRLLLSIFFVTSISGKGFSAPHSECPSAEYLGATYRVSETIRDGGYNEHKVELNRNFSLWRKANEVAHVDKEKSITEIWNVTRHGFVRPVRYFDKDKRAIEYQPTEINNGKGDKDWSLKFQLVSDGLLERMTLKEKLGTGCDRVEHYTFEDKLKKMTMSLAWLPEYKLMKSYARQYKNAEIRWTLDKIETDRALVLHEFSLRQAYKTTDYADIGDNESDPFLRRMIHLGFIEHGASGFYDAKGNTLKGGHQH